MRDLKYHEKRLLKKTNFIEWKRDRNPREVKVLADFGIENREEYHKYNKLAGMITKLVAGLKTLPAEDELRLRIGEELQKKLISMGVCHKDGGIAGIEHLGAGNFAKRRLACVLARLKFAEDVDHAVELIKGGHIRIGPDLVTNPALHVTREMEDTITWAEGSTMKRKIKEFLNERDDFELLGN